MRLAIFILALAPVAVVAQERAPCSFVVGHSTLVVSSKAPAPAGPDWFIVTGAATLDVKQGSIQARFFDSRLGGELSHTVRGKVTRVAGERGRPSQISVTLSTMGTDFGDDTFKGTYFLTREVEGSQISIYRVLVAINPTSFVGIQCYGKGTN